MTNEIPMPASPLPWDIDGRDYFKILDANDVTILGAWHPKPLTDDTANHAMRDVAYVYVAANAYHANVARIRALEAANAALVAECERLREALGKTLALVKGVWESECAEYERLIAAGVVTTHTRADVTGRLLEKMERIAAALAPKEPKDV